MSSSAASVGTPPPRARTDPPSNAQVPPAAASAALAAAISSSPNSQTQEPQPQHGQKRSLHHRLHSNSLFGRPTSSASHQAAGVAHQGSSHLWGHHLPSLQTGRGSLDVKREKGGNGGTGSHVQHSYMQHAKETVQSAIELRPPISFDSIRRRGGGGGGGTHDKHSGSEAGRGSGNTTRNAGLGATESDARMSGEQRTEELQKRNRRVNAGELSRLRKENTIREAELRRSLAMIEEMGMSRTRQLDDTYYAILEKASMLRSTVAGLQQLADEVERTQVAFDTETSQLERETGNSLALFGNFETQESTIKRLVQELEGWRKKTQILNERLESARLRVETYEKRENERESKRRTRWGIVGTILVAVVVLVLAVLSAKYRRSVGHQLDSVGHQLAWVGDTVEEVALPWATKLRPRPSPTEDPYLQRLFDDL